MAHSIRIYERFKRRYRLRRAVALIYLLTAACYLLWRLSIFNENAIFLSGIYYLSDLIAVLLGALTIFVSWHYRLRLPPPAREGLKIDVFIPTYKEPVEMVSRTLKAAVNIRYPHETWLLDDGNRAAMRQLAEELGCHYLARSDNSHAKAGNLNHALGRSSGDFIAVFDADHIPLTHALDETLGFFGDENVGMVQTPQDYYNVDAVQYMNPRRGGLWHDQSFFYNLSQPGRDYYDAASCAGTGVVYRRSALEAIGGVPTETVTEDIHTSLRMQKAGFSVPYFNEPIAYGIAAADLADYYRTRLRYGHGNIHVLRRERILWASGLTWRQRLSYLFLGLIYLEGWQQLMVFLVPAVALIAGVAPFQITILNVVIVLLYPLWSYVLMQEIGCGYSRYWTGEIFSMMRFPVHLLAAAALFRDKMVWRTSQKNVSGRMAWKLLLPQITVMSISLIAVAVGFYRLHGNYTPGPLVAAVVDRLPDKRFLANEYDATSRSATVAMQWVVSRISPPKAENPAAPEGAPRVVVPTAPQPAPPITVATSPAPPPIEWLRPLDRGYTIDLVLIAGFWAMFNALRVIFVIAKVAGNARRTASEYRFRTMLPIRIETADGAIYAVVEELSSQTAVVAGAMRNLAGIDAAMEIRATIYLPNGQSRVLLRRDGARLQRIGRRADFHIEHQTEESGSILEEALYSTRWHRECLMNDAEFMTPLGFLARLWGGAKPRARWHPALVASEDGASTELALFSNEGDLLILADERPVDAILRVIVVGERGWNVRHFRLGPLETAEVLHTSSTGTPKTMYRYRAVTVPVPEIASWRQAQGLIEKSGVVPAVALGRERTRSSARRSA